MANNQKTKTKPKNLQEKLAAAEAKANENWDAVLRAKAELENLQRRAEKDVANAHKYGLEKFVLDLLPVMDSMERGLESCADAKDTKTIHHGMQLTVDMLLKSLNKFKVEQINPLGKDFDPEQHEAMTIKENKSVKPNTVVEVMQKGYLLNGRLIRPALVIVAKSS